MHEDKADEAGTSTLSVSAAEELPPGQVAENVKRLFEELTAEEKVAALTAELEASKAKCEAGQSQLDEVLASQQKFNFNTISKIEVFKFYTRVGTADFKNVLWIIGDAVHRLVYTGTGDEEHEGRDSRGPRRSLSVEDELFLTLCKLRHNFPEDDLAARFMISQSTVSEIFRTWVLCISHSENTSPSLCLMCLLRNTHLHALLLMQLNFLLTNLRTLMSRVQHGHLTKIRTR